MEQKRFITPYEIHLGLNIFKYINNLTSDNFQIWEKNNEIKLNTPYKVVDKEGNCIVLFLDFNNVSNNNMQKIFERLQAMDLEFFMYHYKDRVRIGWRNDTRIQLR